jgi:hypothetical protein
MDADKSVNSYCSHQSRQPDGCTLDDYVHLELGEVHSAIEGRRYRGELVAG